MTKQIKQIPYPPGTRMILFSNANTEKEKKLYPDINSKKIVKSIDYKVNKMEINQ